MEMSDAIKRLTKAVDNDETIFDKQLRIKWNKKEVKSSRARVGMMYCFSCCEKNAN